ncbi:hypothetical protein AMAG_02474 [Allomyces macrogynus ATCC 38327]|uniref:Uncharacterized protein n=1 Tax=Allomyces macrogynus (strain ATCC 38327) TaxID=578462 RepID=A0A0L0S2R3_ALLM3|nr:hypothetical protein AMAG_02474 [Allomyces macrogynus ATCC 38327]|eukprot:KNE56691.1 hypothetical protein AMAG_02474 [Allomyces macrogynus ATCC 38327]
MQERWQSRPRTLSYEERMEEMRARQKRETAGAADGMAAASTTRMFQYPSSPTVDYRQWKIDLANKKQKEIEKAKRLMEADFSTAFHFPTSHEDASTKFSVSDSGYDYEPFDDAYDEGFSVSGEPGSADEDDAWDDAYDGGEAYSAADEAGTVDEEDDD